MTQQNFRRIFWLSFFCTLLLFAAAALFMLAEYNTARSGYTPQPPVCRFARQIMGTVVQWAAPTLERLGL